MKVILTADVIGKGKQHDIIDVSAGYAQNYLFPRKLALVANKNNLKKRLIAIEKATLQTAAEKQAALKLKTQLEKIVLNADLIVHKEHAMGSISRKQVLQMLEEQGFKLNKYQLEMKEKFNHIGSYIILIKLHPEITSQVTLNISEKSPNNQNE